MTDRADQPRAGVRDEQDRAERADADKLGADTELASNDPDFPPDVPLGAETEGSRATEQAVPESLRMRDARRVAPPGPPGSPPAEVAAMHVESADEPSGEETIEPVDTASDRRGQAP